MFLRGATENSKNNLWAKFPFYGQSQKQMSVLLNAKSVFYDSFFCGSLEFQKEISRKRSHKNYLKHRFNARQIYELCALMSNFDFPIKIGRFYAGFYTKDALSDHR